MLALGAVVFFLSTGPASLALSVPGLSSARDFSAPSLAGGTIKLSDYRGKPVVVNFWASWCPPCRAEMPDFERAWRVYKDKGVIFLGVDTSDQDAQARTFLQAMGVTYPSAVDPAGQIAHSFGADGLPTTVILDREGRVVTRQLGGMSADQLATRLDEVLQ